LAIKNTASVASGPRGLVALVHGTSRADKQWPLEHWRALGKRLNDCGYAVALAHGSDNEQRRAQEIASGLASATVWPRLGLDALTDALAACAGVVGVDSGLSHMAVALDLPHVQIYNFDTAWRTGPIGGQSESVLGGTPGARQCSVFAHPAPTVDAVWQAWQLVSRSVAGNVNTA
jgi:heptosyltransferase-1